MRFAGCGEARYHARPLRLGPKRVPNRCRSGHAPTASASLPEASVEVSSAIRVQPWVRKKCTTAYISSVGLTPAENAKLPAAGATAGLRQ